MANEHDSDERVAWDLERFALHGIEVVRSRLTADESFATFAAKLRSVGSEWPPVQLRLLAYDSSDLLVHDTWLELTAGLQPHLRHVSGAIFGEVYRVELLPAPLPLDVGDSQMAGVDLPDVPGSLEALLEAPEAEDRLSKRAVGEELLNLLNGQREHDRVIARVASAVLTKPATPYLTAPPTSWSWPRQEWSEWGDSIVAMLDGVPGNLFRRLQFTGGQDLKIRAEISGRDGEFHVMVVDRKGVVEGLPVLEWSPENLPSSSSVIWHHNYAMAYAAGAVDRLAQALALAVRVASPAQITVHALTFD